MNEALEKLIHALREELQQYGEMLARLDQQQEHVMSRASENLLEATAGIEVQSQAMQLTRKTRIEMQAEVARELSSARHRACSGEQRISRSHPSTFPAESPFVVSFVGVDEPVARKSFAGKQQSGLFRQRKCHHWHVSGTCDVSSDWIIMLGLFGILNMGARSMSVQRAGVEVAGQNLANVSNPAYARQRVAISTSITVQSELGPQGTGSEAVSIVSMRNSILDNQIQSEASAHGMLQAQQTALQYAQAALGTQIDRMASGAEGAAAAQGVGGGHSLADSMDELFNAFQSLSANPTSMAERQTLMMKAESLASQFRQLDSRLASLEGQLNRTIESEVVTVNQTLSNIAALNDRITRMEAISGGTANDLRDMRQAQIEELAKYVKVDLSNGSGGAVNVAIGGVDMIVNNQVVDTVESYTSTGSQVFIRATTATTPLTLTGGSIQGTIQARDVGVGDIRTSMNSIAGILIAQVNTAHSAGFSLSGSTGSPFFIGSDASTIGVTSALVNDPSLIQASAVNGATGDNQVALALARLGQTEFIFGQTLTQAYSQTVATFGQALSTVNNDLANQDTVDNMLLAQRDSIGGVSLDEEMTDLTRFQKAFQASARLITTVDEMLETLVNMKR